MTSTSVRPEQFEISPDGITHKPTGASFSPYPGDPFSGNIKLGQLGTVLPSGDDYRPHDVREMLKQLWEEYVSKNPELFKDKD